MIDIYANKQRAYISYKLKTPISYMKCITLLLLKKQKIKKIK